MHQLISYTASREDHVIHHMVAEADIPFLTIMRNDACSAVVMTMCGSITTGSRSVGVSCDVQCE